MTTYIVYDLNGNMILHCSSRSGVESYREARDICSMIGGSVHMVTWTIDDIELIEEHSGESEFVKKQAN